MAAAVVKTELAAAAVGNGNADDDRFAKFLLESLKAQRKTGRNCDVVLRCGSSAPAHSCVLAAVSLFFRKLLAEEGAADCSSAAAPLEVDVGGLLRLQAGKKGLASLPEQVVAGLYEGHRLVSRDEDINRALADIYATFQLDQDAGFRTQEVAFEPLDPDPPPREEAPAPPEPDAAEDEGQDQKMDESVCRKCQVLFVSKEEFLSHSRMRNCQKKFTCGPCGSMFTRVQSLVSHLVEARHGETVCSVCNFAAGSQSELEAHIQRHGADLLRPYFCTDCDFRFSTKKRWDQHLPKHWTKAPHVCQLCRKGFKWKQALTAHMVTHAEDKKFLCQECGFSTSHVSTFRFHQRNHSGLMMMRCEASAGCLFQTTRRSNLVQHHLTHSKEKPHQCEVCGQSFSLAKNMRRHARQHDLNAAPYSCQAPGCKFSSLRSDKYLEHVKRYHHGEGAAVACSRPPTRVPEAKPGPWAKSLPTTGDPSPSPQSTPDAFTSSPIPSENVVTAAAIAVAEAIMVHTGGSPPVKGSSRAAAEAAPLGEDFNGGMFMKNLFNTISPPNKTVSDAMSVASVKSTTDFSATARQRMPPSGHDQVHLRLDEVLLYQAPISASVAPVEEQHPADSHQQEISDEDLASVLM